MFLPILQDSRFQNPNLGIKEDFQRIYKEGKVLLGWTRGEEKRLDGHVRANTVAIVGSCLGDEGKGRIIDNYLAILLKIPGIKTVWVVRFNGGNNAGHTLIDQEGKRTPVHVVPSIVLHPEARGIMDRGMVIHPLDLKTEVEYLEEAVGTLFGRLFLSEEAILCTDLERAEEKLNQFIKGETKGGTGRGISPSYAHHYDRLGFKMYDFLAGNWKETLGAQYDSYQKRLAAFGLKLRQTPVVDFSATKKERKPLDRPLGGKDEFLARLDDSRRWLISREMVVNTFLLHKKIAQDPNCGILFEGAQGIGLDPWLGTRPDVTSSNTRISGIEEGTAYWRMSEIAQKVGIFKITYMSSVGARHMPTQIDLPKDLEEVADESSWDKRWGKFVVLEAHEFGTTTDRRRDICFLDLPFLIYNNRMGEVETLVGTHLDTAREDFPIKVCTHYTDKKGKIVPYQPGLRHQVGVVPNYIELPGWDGKACQEAKELAELPENAVKFLAFIQARTGYPIVAATCGPARGDFIRF